MDDVVVVDLFTGELLAHFEPDSVQQVDFLRRQARSVRAEIEDLLLAGRREGTCSHGFAHGRTVPGI